MGRKLKDLQQYKMSRGQTSPLQVPASPDDDEPKSKKSRKVPPLKIRVKPADQVNIACTTYIKPKTKKPVILTEPMILPQMTDLKRTKSPSLPAPPANAPSRIENIE